jgi:hypothetical protein
LSFSLAFGVLVVLTWLRPWRSLAQHATRMHLPMISTATFSSVARHGLELLPAIIVLSQLTRRRLLFALYAMIAGALALYLIARFALGYWVA